MRRKNWIAIVALLTAGSVAACGGDAGETGDTTNETQTSATTQQPTDGQQGQTGGTPPEGATADMVAQGAQVFAGKGLCMTCHGPQAQGTPLAPNLTDDEWINISEPSWDNLQQVVRNGVPTPQEHPSPMPPMGGAQLSDEEIQAVSAYVYSLNN